MNLPPLFFAIVVSAIVTAGGAFVMPKSDTRIPEFIEAAIDEVSRIGEHRHGTIREQAGHIRFGHVFGLLGTALAAEPEELHTGAPDAFIRVSDFEGLDPGDLPGQGNWEFSAPPSGEAGSTVDLGALSVVADPSGVDNQVSSITGEAAGFVNLIAIAEGATGTIFYRMYRDGEIDAFAGTTAADTPNAWSSFETQAGAKTPGSDSFRIRNGGEFEDVESGQFRPSTWYCVWTIIDGSSDRFDLYLQGGPYNEPTAVRGSTDKWNFRNGTDDDLDRFYVRSSADTTGHFMIDDVFVDPSGANLSVPQGQCPGTEASEDHAMPIIDPIEDTIVKDGTTVSSEVVAFVPRSNAMTEEAATRINYLYHAKDGSDRLFVNDLNGKIYIINNTKEVSTYLDVAARVNLFKTEGSLNAGLSTFSFHPEFASNGLLYTVHSEYPGDGFDFDHPNVRNPAERTHTVIMEWRATDPRHEEFYGTSREVLRIVQNEPRHGGQLIEFNRSAVQGTNDYGVLYLSIGDSEVSPYFSNVAQMLEYPQGKILRIIPNLSDERGQLSANGKYRIPDDNPFVGAADGALGEIYAYGFRNPMRFDWDPVTGKMLAVNVGEKNLEEVELVEPGNNYGWNIREGTFAFDKGTPDDVYPLPEMDHQKLTYPVAQYDHDDGFAIMGGFIYRGSAVPGLNGSYVFGDIVEGHLFHVKVDDLALGQQATIHALTLLDENGTEIAFNDLIGAERGDLRFGLAADGEIFIMSKQDGVIRRLISS